MKIIDTLNNIIDTYIHPEVDALGLPNIYNERWDGGYGIPPFNEHSFITNILMEPSVIGALTNTTTNSISYIVDTLMLNGDGFMPVDYYPDKVCKGHASGFVVGYNDYELTLL